MTNAARSVSSAMQPVGSKLCIVLCIAVAACGGDARGPGMPSQPGDGGTPDALSPDALPPPDAPAGPATTITAPEAGATTGATVSVEFSAPGTGLHFACRLDAEPASACSSPRLYTGLGSGAHTVFVRAVTADSVAGPEASRSFTVDASLPTVTVSGPPARGSVTNATGTELAFSADKPDATITCAIDGAGPAPCTSPLELSGLGDGVHTVVFQATIGTHVGPQVAWSWTVDTVPPAALITGPVTDGHPVRERLPTLTGTTEPDIAVSIHLASDCGLPVVGTGTAGTGGAFAVKVVAAEPAATDGRTEYFVHASDLAGNAVCSGPFSYFTDNTPPGVAVQPPNAAGTPSRDRRPTLTGTAEALATVRVFRSADCTGPSTAPVTSDGTWSIAIDAGAEAAADGATAYSAQASDSAGNTSCADIAYFTDNTPPAVAVQAPSTSDAPSRQRRPTLTGTAEALATVRVFRGADCAGPSTAPATSDGTWSIAIDAATEAASDGATAYSAQATDPAGNTSCAGTAYFTDNTPPAVVVQPLNTAATPAKNRRPTLTGTGESAAAIRVFRGEGCTGPSTGSVVSTGSWSIATDAATEAAADGATAYSVQATDVAGNTSCAGVAYFTDTTPPAIAVAPLNTAGTPSKQRRPTLTGTSEVSAAVRVFRGAGCAGPSTAPVISTGPWSIATDAATEAAADGTTTYSAQAIDFAGNTSCADVAYFTDNAPPAIAVQDLNTQGTPSKDRRPTLTGTAEALATVRVFRGAGCAGPSTAPVISTGSWSIAIDAATEAAADGATAYSAQAADAAGNTGCVDLPYFTDTTPPAVAAQPPNTQDTPSRNRRPTVTGTAEALATVRVFRGAGCTGPSTTPAISTGSWSIALDAATEAATDGATAYSAQATDVAGNTSCADVSYFTDNTPPAVAVAPLNTASTPSRELQPTWTGTADVAATVRIFRGAGCTGPSTAPVTSTGTWSIATDFRTEAAADGLTSYSAQATDFAGNTSCADVAYFTDTTPPALSVQALNTSATPSTNRRPTLRGTADNAATVRVFRGENCTGPSTAPVTSTGNWSIAIDAATEAAADGLTTYSAQASDAAGNFRCINVSYFTDTSPPAVAITAPVTDALHGVKARRPVLSGTAERGATVQVFRSDACTGAATTTTTASAQGTWSIATDPVTDAAADGPTIYTALATDAVGNPGCSAPFSYFTDSTPPQTTITSSTVSFTNRGFRNLAFTSNEPAAHFECATDDATFAACTSPLTSTAQALGPVKFSVRAIDFAGNIGSPVTFTWNATESPLIQYGFEGDGANTGLWALDAAPDFTGSVQNADFVPGRFGKALAFRTSPSSKFVAPIKDAVRRAVSFNISFWFREDIVRASVGDAALFDNGVLRIFHATAASDLTMCLRSACKTFAYSMGDWHHMRIEWSALEVFLSIDGIEVTSIPDFGSPFLNSTDVEIGRGTNFMVDDLRFFDAELFFTGILGEHDCRIFALYDRNGSCLNSSGASLPVAFEFEQTGLGATRFAPGRVDVYAAQLTQTPLTTFSLDGRSTLSYWLRTDSSSSGTAIQMGNVSHSVMGTRHSLSFLGNFVLAPGWHHFFHSIERVTGGNPIAKLYIDGVLAGQFASASDRFVGTATLGGSGTTGIYIDSLRAYSVSLDAQVPCHLGAAGNWLFSAQTCRLADDLPAGLCVDAAAGSDGASGDCAHPFATITHALSAAAPGQAIVVRPGTYDAAHGEVFPLVVGERNALLGDEINRGVHPTLPTRIAGCAADPVGEGDDVGAILAGPRSSIAGFDLSCATRGRPVVVDADGATVRRVHVAGARIAVAHGAVMNTAVLGNELVDSDTGLAVSGEPRIEGNRITNNGIGLLQLDTSVLDAGGGPRGSRGNNQLYCNTLLDLSTGASVVRARNNAWDNRPPVVATVPTGCIGLRTDICLLTPNATLDIAGAVLAPAPVCHLD